MKKIKLMLILMVPILNAMDNEQKNLAMPKDALEIIASYQIKDVISFLRDKTSCTPFVELKFSGFSRDEADSDKREKLIKIIDGVFSPDSSQLATISSKKITDINIWDVKTGKNITTLITFNNGKKPDKLIFSPDSTKLLAVCSQYLVIWKKESNGRTYQYSPLKSCAYQDILGGTRFGHILFNLHKIKDVMFTKDSNMILVILDNGTVCSCDLVKGIKTDIKKLDIQYEVDWAKFFPGYGKVLTLAQNGILHVCDVKSGKQLYQLTDVTTANISPDGKKIITLSTKNILGVYNATNGQQELFIIDKSKGICHIELSSDNKKILIYSKIKVDTNSSRCDVCTRIFDIDTQKTQDFCGFNYQNGFPFPHFSPNMRYITHSHFGSNCVIDLITHTKLNYFTNLPWPFAWVTYALISPDSQKIFIGRQEQAGTIHVIDTMKNKLLSYLHNKAKEKLLPDQAEIIYRMFDGFLYNSYYQDRFELAGEDFSRYLRIPKYVRDRLEIAFGKPNIKLTKQEQLIEFHKKGTEITEKIELARIAFSHGDQDKVKQIIESLSKGR